MVINNELFHFFKAMADVNRLKIIGLLVDNSFSVEQLAVLLDLSASTVSHHLSILAGAGLVSAKAQSYYNVYSLDKSRIEHLSRCLLSPDTFKAFVQDVDENAYDRKIIHDFQLPNGHLKTIPAQRKKLLIILRWIVRDFDIGKQYTEKEVNQILARYHEDTASLRREMIGSHLLARKPEGVYWRPAPDSQS